MAPAAKPPTTGATGKPRCHRASAAVGLATALIATVAPTASVTRVFLITRPPFLFRRKSSVRHLTWFRRSAPCPRKPNIAIHAWHWRPSTIGLLLSNRSLAPVLRAVRRYGIARQAARERPSTCG